MDWWQVNDDTNRLDDFIVAKVNETQRCLLAYPVNANIDVNVNRIKPCKNMKVIVAQYFEALLYERISQQITHEANKRQGKNT